MGNDKGTKCMIDEFAKVAFVGMDFDSGFGNGIDKGEFEGDVFCGVHHYQALGNACGSCWKVPRFFHEDGEDFLVKYFSLSVMKDTVQVVSAGVWR